jgi:NTE family protein
VGSTGTSDGPAIGLVLGGGGIAGYAFHCGVLSALESTTGFDPRTAEIVVGTSAGAIIGALLRGRVPATVIRDHLLAGVADPDEMARIRLLAGRSARAIPRLWAGPGSPALAMAELRKGRGMRLTRLATGLLPRGRLELDPVSGPLDNLFGAAWPARPLWIPATDLETGERVVFGRDRCPPVARAVEASAALPGFFVPARIDDRTYVDGGIGSPFNVDLIDDYRTADGRPLDLVVVAAPLSLERFNRRDPIDALARALPRRRLQREVAELVGDGVPTLVLEPDRAAARAMGLNPMDHKGLDGIVEQAISMVAERVGRASPNALEVLERAGLLERPPPVDYPSG